MTVLDLIRKLHAEGKPVVAYDIFIYDNLFSTPEEAVSTSEEDATIRIADAYVPPQNLRIGDDPGYIYVEDANTYKKLTRLSGKIPTRYPRLLVPLLYDWDLGFHRLYEGKNWRDIPPIEVELEKFNGLTDLLLDKDGNFCGIAYGGYDMSDKVVTFYPVRTPYGSVFSWLGDIARDPLPEGLTLVSR